MLPYRAKQTFDRFFSHEMSIVVLLRTASVSVTLSRVVCAKLGADSALLDIDLYPDIMPITSISSSWCCTLFFADDVVKCCNNQKLMRGILERQPWLPNL